MFFPPSFSPGPSRSLRVEDLKLPKLLLLAAMQHGVSAALLLCFCKMASSCGGGNLHP